MEKEERVRKPDWLKIRLGNNQHFSRTGHVISEQKLHTICQSGRCPNQGECWNQGSATFMIGGDICTRSCKFCNTKSGRPLPLDPGEPERVALSVRELGIRHAVITSVDRDDLPDYGAAHWAATIRTVKEYNPKITMEVLIPDFRGDRSCLDQIIASAPDIISHNIETVRSLTPSIRSVVGYEQSLDVLKYISDSGIPVKSGIMLGLGEGREEILQTFHDLFESGTIFLSIGQYLQPSKKNISVKEYIPPSRFEEYRQEALKVGFRHVESGPLVRSSYHSALFLSSLSRK